MARPPLPVVEAGALRLSAVDAITIGSSAWFAWLEANDAFAFAEPEASFVARKERARPSGWFWRATATAGGLTRRAYLGRSSQLTLERLWVAAGALAAPSPPSAADPLDALQALRRGPPSPRPGRVSRPRLLGRLRDEAAPLVVVIAPAGYGKTTLLADWIAADGRKAAWLSLDAADSEPRRFWTGVAAALDAVQPGVGARTLALLPSLPPAAAAVVLPTLLEDIAERLTPDARGRPAALVLDDYHTIADRTVHDALVALIEHTPPTLRLVLAGRHDPPLPLPRLRARGMLAEVRADDLAFSADEVGRFLGETMGLALADDVIAALAERTEGWAAAVQIAALALRGRADPAAFVADFRGSQRHVAGYLLEEVIDRQPEEIRRFLLHTAVLDRLCAPLCDAVLGSGAAGGAAGDAASPGALMAALATPPASRAMLDRLDAANLFIVPLEAEGWYRYHHLFADLLRIRLRAEAPGFELELRRRAAAWHETAGYPVAAVEQALAGEDWERAARLIERLADALWRRGDFATLERWVAALPADLARSRPQLLLARAAVAYASRDYHRLPRLVGALEERLARAGDAETEPDGASPDAALRARTTVLRAMAASLNGERARARALAVEARASLPADDAEWRAFLLLQSSFLDVFTDDLMAAGRHAAEGLALAEAAGNHFLVVVMLLQQAHILHDRGRLTAAEAHLARARAVAERLGARALPEAAALDNVAALVCYDLNDLAGAERLLVARRALPEAEGRSLLTFWTAAILARIRAARGEFEAAYEALEEAEHGYRRVAPTDGPRANWTALVFPAWRARLDAARGDLGAVRAWADEAGRADLAEAPLGFWAHSPIPPMLARARLLTGDPAGALELLADLRARAEAGGAGRALLELTALEALSLEALGRREAATATLSRALALAEPEGSIRPFLDEGAPIVELARRVAGRGAAGATHAGALLTAADPGRPRPAPATRPESLVEPLTARELDVLRLIADGLPNQAIANRLFLTVGTVKWYAGVIYGKLGAERRTEAIALARAVGLLD